MTMKIRSKYFADPDIKPWNVDVTTTSGGHVILRGEVGDADDRDTAVRIARDIDGVTAVDDLLRVTTSPVATGVRAGRRRRTLRTEAGDLRLERPDLWITTRIQAKFYADADVHGRNVDVATSGAVVTLHGAVDSAVARRRALALARNTDGVRDVRDELQIDSTVAASNTGQPHATANVVDDAWILTKIGSKYFLDQEVKHRAVQVTVEDGVVTLRGAVHSDGEKDTAEQIAAETGGVTGVRNQLQVRAAAARG
jgi:osmotically-inducible protein OsmY